MGTRTAYPPEVKQAAIAALLAGTPTNAVAVKFRVAEATVRSWKAREAHQFAPTVAQDARAHFGQRVLDFLHKELDALNAQAQLFADPEWLKGQNAHDLGILHGVCIDKAVRLLEALESRADVDDAAAGGDAGL